MVGGGGWGEADIFTPGDPARRVSLKWRRSIELRGHRAKGGDADGDVERYASEAPSSAQPLLRVCLFLSVRKVFFYFIYFSSYIKGYGWSHLGQSAIVFT